VLHCTETRSRCNDATFPWPCPAQSCLCDAARPSCCFRSRVCAMARQEVTLHCHQPKSGTTAYALLVHDFSLSSCYLHICENSITYEACLIRSDRGVRGGGRAPRGGAAHVASDARLAAAGGVCRGRGSCHLRIRLFIADVAVINPMSRACSVHTRKRQHPCGCSPCVEPF
jgi:hypothetical protein